MNRRQALIAILLAPAGQFVKESKNGQGTFVGTLSYAVSLQMNLADKPEDGITSLEVTYNSKSKKFSAKEIWEAL